MKYRDALDSSKGCPKCCSKTLERFSKVNSTPPPDPLPKPESIVVEAPIEKKNLPKPRR